MRPCVPTAAGRTFCTWFGLLGSRDRAAWAEAVCEEAMAPAALLLGRRSYEWFAARWPSRSGAWADRLNALPEYVVTPTARAGQLDGADVVGEVVRVDGDVVVHAGFRLVGTLLEHDLVDELRLMACPVVLGAPGGRLFGETGARKPMGLTGTCTVGDGLLLTTCRPARDTG